MKKEIDFTAIEKLAGESAEIKFNDKIWAERVKTSNLAQKTQFESTNLVPPQETENIQEKEKKPKRLTAAEYASIILEAQEIKTAVLLALDEGEPLGQVVYQAASAVAKLTGDNNFMLLVDKKLKSNYQYDHAERLAEIYENIE